MGKMKQLAAALFVSALAAVSAPAMATVPTGVDTAYTAILTDAATIQGYAVPVVIGIVGLVVVIGLLKKFAYKAS